MPVFWSGLPGYQSRVLESGDVQMSGLGDCVLVLKMCDGRRKQQCILLFVDTCLVMITAKISFHNCKIDRSFVKIGEKGLRVAISDVKSISGCVLIKRERAGTIAYSPMVIVTPKVRTFFLLYFPASVFLTYFHHFS